MKKLVWPLIIIFFLLGGLAAILLGQFILPPEPRPETVEAISEQWSGSAHADSEAESFVHWDEDDPPVISTSCAKCHSAYGFLDYLGEDETEPNQGTSTDNEANTGSVVSCFVCHNDSAHVKTSAYFPSGETIDTLEESAICAECHQGRRSGLDVEKSTVNLPEDEVNEELGFINIHYKIAAAVRYGTDVITGYEYPELSYSGFFNHVEDYQLCTDCHNPHSLLINPDECAACHSEVSDYGDLRDIRTEDTLDFDGDGDTAEGVYGELTKMHDMLYSAIQAYAEEVSDQSIVYAFQNPYWFIDTNGNGEADEGETERANSYGSWTPRLVKATYNYHLVLEDPGGFTHNARYLIQLIYDTLDDLSEVVDVEMSGLLRPE